jgi:hypothetical protein
MCAATPRHKIGDFVKCSYSLIDFHFYLYGDEDSMPYFKYYGIVMDHTYDGWWDEMEPVYKIYCMDGICRFFLEDEICLV